MSNKQNKLRESSSSVSPDRKLLSISTPDPEICISENMHRITVTSDDISAKSTATDSDKQARRRRHELSTSAFKGVKKPVVDNIKLNFD